VTFDGFMNEQAYVINAIMYLKSLEIEEQEKQVNKAKRKNGK